MFLLGKDKEDTHVCCFKEMTVQNVYILLFVQSVLMR